MSSLLYGAVGSILYLLFIAFDFQEFASGGWLDMYEIYLVFAPIGALLFLFASSASLTPSIWKQSFLDLCISITIIFGFPNISFPVGGTYFYHLQSDFGHLSLFMAFFTLTLYVHFYNEPQRKG